MVARPTTRFSGRRMAARAAGAPRAARAAVFGYQLAVFPVVSVSQFSPFESKLTSHLHSLNGCNRFSNRLGWEHLQQLPATNFRYTVFAWHFDALAHGYSKSLVLLFISLMVVPRWLLFWRQRRYFVERTMLNTYLFANILLVCAIMIFFSLSSLVVPRLVPIYNDDNFISLVMLLLTTGYMALFFNAAFPRPRGLRGWRKVASTAWRWSKPLVFTIAFGVALVVPTVGCCF